MYIPGQPEVNRQHALAAARLWGADGRTVEHIGDFGNSVYAVARGGEQLILRLTEPSFRSWSDNQAELSTASFWPTSRGSSACASSTSISTG